MKVKNIVYISTRGNGIFNLKYDDFLYKNSISTHGNAIFVFKTKQILLIEIKYFALF